MTAVFMVRARIVDPAAKNGFDRVWGEKVTRSRDFVEIIQTAGN